MRFIAFVSADGHCSIDISEPPWLTERPLVLPLQVARGRQNAGHEQTLTENGQ
jgi:hypothetical protein